MENEGSLGYKLYKTISFFLSTSFLSLISLSMNLIVWKSSKASKTGSIYKKLNRIKLGAPELILDGRLQLAVRGSFLDKKESLKSALSSKVFGRGVGFM
ncbi:hypothetical protein M9H77_17247 [Catharanthus roseus]|uniref:Uncharacterized protein n=1 Tax=Catharanthus roseus TaxID=4058 RepID=A0ACC0B425_CATRO|nr:hypothetical protein M9H77_17247 [Catharanthus roseus]